MTHGSQVHQNRYQEPQQVDPCHWQSAIDQPRVHQRRERQEYEAEDEEQDALEGPVQIVREQEKKRYRDAREREDQDQE